MSNNSNARPQQRRRTPPPIRPSSNSHRRSPGPPRRPPHDNDRTNKLYNDVKALALNFKDNSEANDIQFQIFDKHFENLTKANIELVGLVKDLVSQSSSQFERTASRIDDAVKKIETSVNTVSDQSITSAFLNIPPELFEHYKGSNKSLYSLLYKSSQFSPPTDEAKRIYSEHDEEWKQCVNKTIHALLRSIQHAMTQRATTSFLAIVARHEWTKDCAAIAASVVFGSEIHNLYLASRTNYRTRIARAAMKEVDHHLTKIEGESRKRSCPTSASKPTKKPKKTQPVKSNVVVEETDESDDDAPIELNANRKEIDQLCGEKPVSVRSMIIAKDDNSSDDSDDSNPDTNNDPTTKPQKEPTKSPPKEQTTEPSPKKKRIERCESEDNLEDLDGFGFEPGENPVLPPKPVVPSVVARPPSPVPVQPIVEQPTASKDKPHPVFTDKRAEELYKILTESKSMSEENILECLSAIKQ